MSSDSKSCGTVPTDSNASDNEDADAISEDDVQRLNSNITAFELLEQTQPELLLGDADDTEHMLTASHHYTITM